MSASSKKKLRKEQKAEQLTERQLQEQKEAKQLKIISTVFVAVMALILIVGITITAFKTVTRSGIMEKSTVAAVIGDEKLNTVELSYYYVDAINAQYNEWYEMYGDSTTGIMQMMGFDMTQPLDTQYYEPTEEYTWADYFVDAAIEKAKYDLALTAEAEKNGFTLPEEDKTTVDNQLSTDNFYAQIYGFSSLDQYLQNSYCYGASEKTYRAYRERSALAKAYAEHYSEELTYSDDQIRAKDSEDLNAHNSYTFDSYYIGYTQFREGGTVGEDGLTTYTEEENNQAREYAKNVAETLKATITDTESFNKAIADVLEEEEPDTCEVNEKVIYTDINEKYAEWLADESRKDGDVEIFANTIGGSTEGEEVTNGYYVVLFHSSTDNTEHMSNVRHLLVAFEETEEGEDGPTDEQKATAKTKAEELLISWKEGGATEESFIELVHDNTDDEASAETGGLYENIYSGSNYVPNFLSWSIDESRQAGDTDIVETEHGYHIMYYVGRSELNYRDHMITEELRANDVAQWQTGLLEAVTAEKANTSRMHTDIVLSSEA